MADALRTVLHIFHSESAERPGSRRSRSRAREFRFPSAWAEEHLHISIPPVRRTGARPLPSSFSAKVVRLHTARHSRQLARKERMRRRALVSQGNMQSAARYSFDSGTAFWAARKPILECVPSQNGFS